MLTKDHAEKIAAKLKARMRSGAKHELAVFEYEGRIIAQFGIRRGSRKDQVHDFIPNSIHLNRRDTLALASGVFVFLRGLDTAHERQGCDPRCILRA